jgi:hypothetical protein
MVPDSGGFFYLKTKFPSLGAGYEGKTHRAGPDSKKLEGGPSAVYSLIEN